ncbi:thrombospondin type 3 repeat-containing protein [Persicimonas caeni]|uniref:thrombospondin type 3 repeat-containing protein n=1 Tax=Persicimonas caeni TaxID=2292766 RepID=UPI001C9A3D74
MTAAACGDDTTRGDGAGLGEACETSADCADGMTCVDGACAADTDGDGALDPVDNCPDVANPDQG